MVGLHYTREVAFVSGVEAWYSGLPAVYMCTSPANLVLFCIDLWQLRIKFGCHTTFDETRFVMSVKNGN